MILAGAQRAIEKSTLLLSLHVAIIFDHEQGKKC